MNELLTKWQLFSALTAPEPRKPTRFLARCGIMTGQIQAVERESGNGSCFNVTVLLTEDSAGFTAGQSVTVFVRTSD